MPKIYRNILLFELAAFLTFIVLEQLSRVGIITPNENYFGGILISLFTLLISAILSFFRISHPLALIALLLLSILAMYFSHSVDTSKQITLSLWASAVLSGFAGCGGALTAIFFLFARLLEKE